MKSQSGSAAAARMLGSIRAWFVFLVAVTLSPAQSAEPLDVETLSQGYSLLYADVSSLQHVYKGLLLKQESDETEALVGDLASYMKVLEGDLRDLAATTAIDIDLNPLPEAERRKQAAAAKARITGFAPVTGRTGRDFERTLLLTLAGALNQLRHLSAELEAAEQPGERKRRMARASERLDALYEKYQRDLNARFYVVNSYAE